jgi:hypothetical protein
MVENIVACIAVARQQIPNTHQCTKWKQVFSTRSVLQMRDTKVKEMLEAVFSMPPMPRCYKEDNPSV